MLEDINQINIPNSLVMARGSLRSERNPETEGYGFYYPAMAEEGEEWETVVSWLVICAKVQGCVLYLLRECTVEEDECFPMILTVKAHTFRESGNGRKYSMPNKKRFFLFPSGLGSEAKNIIHK